MNINLKYNDNEDIGNHVLSFIKLKELDGNLPYIKFPNDSSVSLDPTHNEYGALFTYIIEKPGADLLVFVTLKCCSSLERDQNDHVYRVFGNDIFWKVSPLDDGEDYCKLNDIDRLQDLIEQAGQDRLESVTTEYFMDYYKGAREGCRIT